MSSPNSGDVKITTTIQFGKQKTDGGAKSRLIQPLLWGSQDRESDIKISTKPDSLRTSDNKNCCKTHKTSCPNSGDVKIVTKLQKIKSQKRILQI